MFQVMPLKIKFMWCHPTELKCQGDAYYKNLRKFIVLREEDSK